MNYKIEIWDILILIFISIVMIYGMMRSKYDLRWSSWALGDAQNLNAANHFVEEGFKEHYFLPYYHAGYLGKSQGNESKTGYYTRYPPLSVWIIASEIHIINWIKKHIPLAVGS